MEGNKKSDFRKMSLYSNILACFQVADAPDPVVQSQNGTTLPLQESLVDLENNYIFDRRSQKNSILLRVQRDRTMRRLSSLKRTFLGAKEGQKRSCQALYSMVESVPPQLKSSEDLYSPVSAGRCMVCIIKVEPSGALDLSPIYRIYSASKGEFLLSARKVGAGFTQYAISSSPKLIDPTKKWCVGRLRSNIISTEWVLHENKQETGHEAETLLATYKTNLFGLGGPRELKISIPAPPSRNYEKPVSSVRSPTNLRQSLKHSSSQVLVYSSRKPEYDQARKKYRLRIGNGDVDQFDQKNLILEREGEVPLICGRLSAESFYVQIQSSLSPLQAFAVCLSNFDKKLWVQ